MVQQGQTIELTRCGPTAAVVNTALPHIAADLHAGLTGVQWVFDAYTLALATVVLSAGSVADRFGRRRIFIWGMGLFTLSSLACALAQNIAVLDGARAVQGTTAAMLFASSVAILANAYPGHAERAQAFALYGATIGASFALGPFVGGALTSGFSWQAVFYVNLPFGILALVASFAWLRESKTRRHAVSTGPDRQRSRPACSCWCSRCCAETRRAGRAPASSPSTAQNLGLCRPSTLTRLRRPSTTRRCSLLSDQTTELADLQVFQAL